MPNEMLSNSHRYKEQEEHQKAEKIVQGPVNVRKKSGFAKLADIFIAKDINDVVMDIVVPAAKRTALDMIGSLLGVDIRSVGSSTPSSRVNYHNMYDRGSAPAPRARSTFDMDDILFDRQIDATNVLDSMCNTLMRYKFVSVGDMYDFAGYRTKNTDYDYGWVDLGTASIGKTVGGQYYLRLPRAMPRD